MRILKNALVLRRTVLTLTSRQSLPVYSLQFSRSLVSFSIQPAPKQNLTEKIVQKYSVDLPEGKVVKAGDYVSIKPYHCMSHDNSWPVATKFMSIGATKIFDNRQVVMTLDHDVQNTSEANLRKYDNIEKFAEKQGVDFYGAGRGIGHQIMVEEGYAWPGTLTVASDSHTNMYGGIGCLGTPIVRTDAAAIWATGQTWWQVPPVAKVNLTGELPKGVTGKDVIVALCGLFNQDQVLNHAIEFVGSLKTLATIPVDDRLAIANMTTEWGALSGLFPVDSLTRIWLRAKATAYSQPSILQPNIPEYLSVQSIEENFPKNHKLEERPGLTTQKPHPRITHSKIFDISLGSNLQAHPEATYAKELSLNLSTLSPYVAGPNSVKVATPLSELPEDITIQKAYLVSCTNSRASDLGAAAAVVRSTNPPGKVADGVEFYVAAASLPEQKIAEDKGDWQTLLEAGARPLPAGCGPCIGMGTGLLKAGETGISATNRNFKGRMGDPAAKAYLASPEVVTASAIAGRIASPGFFVPPETPVSVETSPTTPEAPVDVILSSEKPSQDTTTILPGFPPVISGEIVFCDADNLNTDGIYPGKYTYQDGLTRDDMAKVCMENYDPEFVPLTKPGDILVSGFNFGCGSSREQAATCILARDIPLVVSGSFGNIFSRNSVNNALLTVEVPELIRRLREKFAGQETKPTRRTGWKFEWDIGKSWVEVVEADENGQETKRWGKAVGELPPNVQEIFARGGLEGWVKSKIAES